MGLFVVTLSWMSLLIGHWVAAIPSSPFFNLPSSQSQAEQTIKSFQPGHVVQRGAPIRPFIMLQTNPGPGGISSGGSVNPTTRQAAPVEQASPIEAPQDIGTVANSTVISPVDAINTTLIELCTTICQNFANLKAQCQTPHCGCNKQFLSAQGYSGLCESTDPVEASAVQFLLDVETAQCRGEGIQIHFQLKLPPAVQAIVDQTNAESALLRMQQKVYLVLQILGGHIGLPIILILAIFSRKVKRELTFLNFCFTWIFSSIVYSLLLYGNTADDTVLNTLGEVPQNKCLIQASFTEGAQVLTASSTLALLIRLSLDLRATIYGGLQGQRTNKYVTISLLVIPYILFLIFALVTIFIGAQEFVVPGAVGAPTLPRTLPLAFYCTIVEPVIFDQVVYGVILVASIFSILSDIYIIIILYRHWWALRQVKTSTVVSLSVLLRVIFFTLYRIVVAIAYGFAIKRVAFQVADGKVFVLFNSATWIELLQAAIPLVGTIVFGTSHDILSYILFWRKKEDLGISHTSPSVMSNTSSGGVTISNIRDSKVEV